MYVMNDEQIRALAPAVFQEEPAPTVSANYAFVSTRAIVEAMRGEGWMVSSAGQANTRKPERRAYAKHLLRFRREDVQLKLNGLIPEIVLRNAHAGNGRYFVDAGVMRLVCLNGHVVGDMLLPGIAVRHTKTAVQGVLEATSQIAAQMPEVMDRVEAMQGKILTPVQQMGLALEGLNIRWPDGTAPLPYDQLLKVRRPEDTGDDLWTVFNRIQENLLAPTGLRANVNEETGRRRALRRMTAMRGVPLNKKLWDRAQTMLEVA